MSNSDGYSSTSCILALASPRVMLSQSLVDAADLAVSPTQHLSSLKRRKTLRVAVIGVNERSILFVKRVAHDPRTRLRIVGIYDDVGDPGNGGRACLGDGSVHDLIAHQNQHRIDAAVIILPLSEADRVRKVRALLCTMPVNVYLAGEVLDHGCKRERATFLGPNSVIKVDRKPLSDGQAILKGIVDRVLSAFLLILLLPALAVIVLAIRLDSRGPAVFKQPRIGLHNAMFTMLKFRTMHEHLSDVNVERQVTRGDPRVTRVGKILRRTSLDELPQLINVLFGDMSLVGPRPHAPNTKAGNKLFHEIVAEYPLRHKVKPGITGWAQVNGWRGETRTHHQLECRVAYDLHYIENWSIWLDFKILLMTALHQFTSNAAY